MLQDGVNIFKDNRWIHTNEPSACPIAIHGTASRYETVFKL